MTAPGLGRLLPGIQRAGQGGLAGDDLDQLQVFDAVRAVLVGCAQRSPVVLVLEDLHWADRASHDLVVFLARTLRSGRVMLVAATDLMSCTVGTRCGRSRPSWSGSLHWSA